MVEYEYLPDPKIGARKAVRMTDDQAAKDIGGRVLCGFEVVQRYFRAPDDLPIQITYFQSDVTGRVWALYY